MMKKEGENMEKVKILLSQLERIDYPRCSSKKTKDIFTDLMIPDNGSYTHYYKCPCGKGRVVDDNDATPGYRCHDTYIECQECKEKYDVYRY
jgi:hypothetical protein